MNNFFEFCCIDERADQISQGQLDVKILAIFFEAKIVLADTGKDFVTWRYWIDEEAFCHFEHGHYFGYTYTPKEDQLAEAKADYEHRVNIELLGLKEALEVTV